MRAARPALADARSSPQNLQGRFGERHGGYDELVSHANSSRTYTRFFQALTSVKGVTGVWQADVVVIPRPAAPYCPIPGLPARDGQGVSMLRTYAPRDQTCPGLRGRSDAVQVVSGVSQFRAGSPDPAYGSIAAAHCSLHRLVTSGPDVAAGPAAITGKPRNRITSSDR